MEPDDSRGFGEINLEDAALELLFDQLQEEDVGGLEGVLFAAHAGLPNNISGFSGGAAMGGGSDGAHTLMVGDVLLELKQQGPQVHVWGTSKSNQRLKGLLCLPLFWRGGGVLGPGIML